MKQKQKRQEHTNLGELRTNNCRTYPKYCAAVVDIEANVICITDGDSVIKQNIISITHRRLYNLNCLASESFSTCIIRYSARLSPSSSCKFIAVVLPFNASNGTQIGLPRAQARVNMSKKAKDNPFSFFAYDKKGSATGVGGDLFDEDIFADSPLPGPKGRSTTSSATAGTGGSTTGDNPFSFFNQSQGSKDKDVPPPPPNSSNKSVKDRDKLFSTSSSVSDDDDDDSWATPVIPSKPSTKKGLAPPLPDMFPLGLASPRCELASF